MTPVVLYAPDAHLRRSLQHLLEGAGFTVRATNDPAVLSRYILTYDPALVLVQRGIAVKRSGRYAVLPVGERLEGQRWTYDAPEVIASVQNKSS